MLLFYEQLLKYERFCQCFWRYYISRDIGLFNILNNMVYNLEV